MFDFEACGWDEFEANECFREESAEAEYNEALFADQWEEQYENDYADDFYEAEW